MMKILMAIVVTAAMAITGCNTETPRTATKDTVVVHDTTVVVDTTAKAAVADSTAMITLPVLDAFFADSSFTAELKQRLSLSDSQVDSLRRMAREETAKLGESDSGSTPAARQLAMERIGAIIGPEKGLQLATLVGQRWNVAADSSGATANRIPADTRIVVNAPAYRMDVFEKGRLAHTYKIAIGYPEFPLPTGLRTAKTIIFNPTWTPPDEPWVESSRKAKVGQTVAAGSSLNPLGMAKIPIGLPSLIHGGKNQSQLGALGSHGCVGLTDKQMRGFVMELAGLTGASVTDSMIKAYAKKRSQTETVELKMPVPVELRYETIVAEDGQLHIYRDVYDRGTNTEAALGAALATYGVRTDQLTEQERTQVMAALRKMAGTGSSATDSATADTASATTTAVKGSTKSKAPVKITRSVPGAKEVVIPIAALKGKGYPAAAGE